MSKRGENIYKRKDGRWEGRYVKSRDSSGRPRLGYVYGKTYRETKEKLWKEKMQPSSCSSSRNLFSRYCDEWLLLRRNCVKPSTYIKYHGMINRQIKPALGKVSLQHMSTVLAEEFSHSLLTEKGLSPKTVKDILVVLRAVLQHAKRQTGEHFQMEVVYPKESKKEMRVMSLEEQKRLTAFLLRDPSPDQFGIMLALLTGMRIGEVCALRWRDICLDPGEIRVRATMQRLQKLEPVDGKRTEIVVGEAKSYASCRTIPLTGTALQLCGKMRMGDPNAFVLTARADRFMEPRALQYRLKKYTKACGISDIHFHTLRHTFATRCVEVDFEVKSLSEILGHASAKVTLDRYVHSSIELKRKNMKKLAAAGL